MKCLSVSQPYADLIVVGKKVIELRTWNTKFRGEFLVHAPLKVKIEACRRLGIDETGLRTGAIVGKVELYDVKVYGSVDELESDYEKHLAGKEYFNHRYGFLLRNPKKLRLPIACKGWLGFFNAQLDTSLSDNDIRSELFDEEFRYQLVGKH